MQIIALQTKLIFKSDEDKLKLIKTLELERGIFNFCSPLQFNQKCSIVELHAKVYNKARAKFNAKSQIVIKAENNCLSAYRSIKSNKVKLDKPIEKKRLATSYDQRLYRYAEGKFYLTTINKRVEVELCKYNKLVEYLSKYKFGDPTIFSKNGEVYISLPFKVETIEGKQTLALGIDLGIRRVATTSDGRLFIDRGFNARKRKLRYLKRQLRSKTDKGSRSAKRLLVKLCKKERNSNICFIHNLANRILDTKANIIVLEDLKVKQLKSKKNRYQSKNRISQISFAELRFILTYKAALKGKRVVCVSPYYTSQLDHVNGKLGNRVGCRFYSKNGLVYDADINAAVNIAKRSKLPYLCSNVLDGQGLVIGPMSVYSDKPPVLIVGI